MLLCPSPSTSKRPAWDLGTHERVAGYCPKLCKLLLNFTPAFLQAVSVTGYVVVSETCPEQSDHCSPVAWVDRASCWLEEKSRVRAYKEEAAVALSSQVPGACLANVELSSRMDFISYLSAAWRESAAVLPFAVSGTVSVISQLAHFLIVSLVGWDGICLLFACLFVFKTKIIKLGCCQNFANLIREAGGNLRWI